MAGTPPYLRMRKRLDGPLPPPAWPQGMHPATLDVIDPRAAHQVLATALPTEPFDTWYRDLVNDSEYDPALCIAAVDANGAVAGIIQCWTSAFVKDLAVAQPYRGRGVGTALMHHAFQIFDGRGASHVDLKVVADNQSARRLYVRLGMVEVAD